MSQIKVTMTIWASKGYHDNTRYDDSCTYKGYYDKINP